MYVLYQQGCAPCLNPVKQFNSVLTKREKCAKPKGIGPCEMVQNVSYQKGIGPCEMVQNVSYQRDLILVKWYKMCHIKRYWTL